MSSSQSGLKQHQDNQQNVWSKWIQSALDAMSPGRHSVQTRSAMKEILKRRTKGLPKSLPKPQYDSDGSTDIQLLNDDIRLLRERAVFELAYGADDYQLMRVLDEKSAQHDTALLWEAVRHLRAYGVADVFDEITAERMDTLVAFRDATLAPDLLDLTPTLDYTDRDLFCGYVMMNPTDRELVQQIMGRGIREYSAVMTLLKDMKTADIPSAVSEGYI